MKKLWISMLSVLLIVCCLFKSYSIAEDVFPAEVGKLVINEYHAGDNGSYEYGISVPEIRSWRAETNQYSQSVIITISYFSDDIDYIEPTDIGLLHIEQVEQGEFGFYEYEITVPKGKKWFMYDDRTSTGEINIVIIKWE